MNYVDSEYYGDGEESGGYYLEDDVSYPSDQRAYVNAAFGGEVSLYHEQQEQQFHMQNEEQRYGGGGHGNDFR